MRITIAAVAFVVMALIGGPARAQDYYLGEIRLVPYNFAPSGWAFCDGQLLSISQNTALFSLIGTTYGGDGQTTFVLPDLRGRVSLHAGTAPGVPDRTLGGGGGGASTQTVNLIGKERAYMSGEVSRSPGTTRGRSRRGDRTTTTCRPISRSTTSSRCRGSTRASDGRGPGAAYFS